MALKEEVTGIGASLKLNNGVDSEGKAKYVNLSLGSMDADGYDNAKAWAVVEKLVSCLQLTMDSFNKTTYSSIVEE